MVENSSGIILRTRPLTETSLIVNWLTPDFGRLSTVAKGARRIKSPFRGKLDLFYLAEFSFQRSRRSDLHTVREVNLVKTHDALRRDIDYLHQASYCAALIEQATESETPIPAIFTLLKDFLAHLPEHPAQPLNVFAFEMKLLSELGLHPDLAGNRLNATTNQLLERLGNESWPTVLQIQLTPAQIIEIRQFLHGFLIFHLGRLAHGRAAALMHHA